MTASVADRLAAGAAADENGCLTWKRCVNSRGYGQIGINGKVLLAGHPLEGHNVIVKVRKDGGLSRSCRECQYAARRTGRPRGRPGHRDYAPRDQVSA